MTMLLLALFLLLVSGLIFSVAIIVLLAKILVVVGIACTFYLIIKNIFS